MKKLLSILSATVMMITVFCTPVFAADSKKVKSDDYFTINIPDSMMKCILDKTSSSDKKNAYIVTKAWLSDDGKLGATVVVQNNSHRYNYKKMSKDELDKMASDFLSGMNNTASGADCAVTLETIDKQDCLKISARNYKQQGADKEISTDCYIFSTSKHLIGIALLSYDSDTLDSASFKSIVQSIKIKRNFFEENMIYIIIGVVVLAVIVVVFVSKKSKADRKIAITGYEMSNNFESYNTNQQQTNNYNNNSSVSAQDVKDRYSQYSQPSSQNAHNQGSEGINPEDFFGTSTRTASRPSQNSIPSQPSQSVNPDDFFNTDMRKAQRQSQNNPSTPDYSSNQYQPSQNGSTDMGSLSVPDTDIDFGPKKKEDKNGWLNS